MYFKAAKTYNSLNWNYLEISDEIIKSRYDWVNISFPSEDRKSPWAHEHNIIRLFLLCRTFSSKVKALRWIEEHLESGVLPIHLFLMNTFCYRENTTLESLDELIDRTYDNDLLNFIQISLDRSLLWHNPEPCWPSDFIAILRRADEILGKGTNQQLKWVDNPEVEGVDFVADENYTHVFYKFQNLINGIAKGELYYEIKDLSRQAHGALLKSMELFFEHRHIYSFLSQEAWERKLDEIALKETDWCKVQIQNKMKN